MNEIELQKLLVKEAFAKQKAIPDFGGIGDENSIKLRDYIWKICGDLKDENVSATTNKKNALVALYRLWSAFTKNIRYIIDKKGKSVTLPRFGTITRKQSDPLSACFIPSSDLASSLNAERSNEES